MQQNRLSMLGGDFEYLEEAFLVERRTVDVAMDLQPVGAICKSKKNTP